MTPLAETASDDVIQCLVSHRSWWPIGAFAPRGGASAFFTANLWYQGFPGWDPKTQAPRFWVLNRANPIAKPTTFVAPDSNTVPAGLAELMDADHLLVAGIFSDAHRVPQGALFNFLVDNGAGAALSMIENLNVNAACGLQCMFAYTMVSVAGGNEGPGIELLTVPVPMHSESNTSGLEALALAPFQFVREDGGMYYPIKNQL